MILPCWKAVTLDRNAPKPSRAASSLTIFRERGRKNVTSGWAILLHSVRSTRMQAGGRRERRALRALINRRSRAVQSNPPRSASAICARTRTRNRGEREAAEITAIIAIEVRTDRCLLNPIGNRREVEHDLLPRFRVPIPCRGSNERTRRTLFTPKHGRIMPFNPRVNGAYPAKRCNHNLRSHVSRSHRLYTG